MLPTLPRLAVGSEVWALLHVAGAWKPTLLGRVARAKPSGYEVRGPRGRFVGRTECPLFASSSTATTWATANPLRVPTAPAR